MSRDTTKFPRHNKPTMAVLPEDMKISGSNLSALELAYIDRQGRKGLKGRMVDLLRPGRFGMIRGITDDEGKNFVQLARSEEATLDIPASLADFEATHAPLVEKVKAVLKFVTDNP